MTGPLLRTRRPAVAGRFYPRDATALAAAVDRLLDAVDVPETEPPAAAYVVPHAGYAFSGPTAAHAYARLRRHAGRVRRVVLIGPSHFVRLAGCAAPLSRVWTTPLGDLPVDEPTGLVTDDAPHASEHSLEVQLPFLQRALGRPVPILPVAVGDAAPARVAGHLAAAAATPGTVVLCSTDLSHYLDHAAAAARDARTAAAITALDPDRISPRDACGVYALRGLLAWAGRTGLRAHPLDLRTSAETAGEPARVVGYGAFALYAGRVPGQRAPG